MKTDGQRLPSVGREPTQRRAKFARLLPIFGSLVVLSAAILARAQTVTYGYDSNGRLVCVTNPSGTTAVYAYDTVGNLTSITNTACPVSQPTPAPSSTPPAPVATPT